MRGLADNSVDSIVTDPPYELGFMGKDWDKSGIANNVEVWKEALRVLKPGGHLLAFSGSRTYHRMTCAIEDAGFEVRDQIMWVYGSGFPKSLNVSKAIDKSLGAIRETVRVAPRPATSGTMAGSTETRPWIEKSRELGYHEVAGDTPASASASAWRGWGTALKPAHEPICVARKPLCGTVATNILRHGTGALNIDACRVGDNGGCAGAGAGAGAGARVYASGLNGTFAPRIEGLGRWPANFIHDGSAEIVRAFPNSKSTGGRTVRRGGGDYVGGNGNNQISFTNDDPGYGDDGSAARFFYCPKASKRDRDAGLENFNSLPRATMGSGIGGQPDQQRANNKNTHPTVKPTDLMAYLVRLVTPPGGLVLDPFMGSGSTGKACMREGFSFIGIDLQAEYVEISRARIIAAKASPEPGAQSVLFAEA